MHIPSCISMIWIVYWTTRTWRDSHAFKIFFSQMAMFGNVFFLSLACFTEFWRIVSWALWKRTGQKIHGDRLVGVILTHIHLLPDVTSRTLGASRLIWVLLSQMSTEARNTVAREERSRTDMIVSWVTERDWPHVQKCRIHVSEKRFLTKEDFCEMHLITALYHNSKLSQHCTNNSKFVAGQKLSHVA